MGLRELIGLAGVPVIAALVQIVKLWIADQRLWPVAALLLGVAINVGAAVTLGFPWWDGLAYGVVAGLAAAGLYDVGKDAIKK